MEYFGKQLLVIALGLLIVLAVSSSFYKYIILGDFETIFYSYCEDDISDCFKNTFYCNDTTSLEDCLYYYKVYIVNQGQIDNYCHSPDEGECLKDFCSLNDNCKILDCSNMLAKEYGILDECQNKS